MPPYPANRINGNHNTIRRCHIAYSAGTGLDIQGEGNTLTNCVIHDIGYMGTYEGAVQVKGTTERSSITAASTAPDAT